MNANVVKLNNQLCHRFYTVSNAFTRAYRPMLKRLDLTYPQYIVMMALWENDDIAISQLLEVTHIDGGAMSLILKKLTTKGYLAVSASEQDKRVKYVRLTKEGRHIQTEAAEIADAMRCNIKNLTADDAKQLMVLIDKLSDDLTLEICG
jgi:DNA-binding MarR family transcriptional regulator